MWHNISMKFSNKLVILGIVVVTTTVIITDIGADEDVIDSTTRKYDLPVSLVDCKKIMMRVAKKALKAFGKCSREMKKNVSGDHSIYEQKIGCIVKCTLVTMDLLDKAGKVSKSTIQKFNDEMIPTEAHEFAHDLAEECVSFANNLDPNQEKCESYAEYATCMQHVIGEFAETTDCHPHTPH